MSALEKETAIQIEKPITEEADPIARDLKAHPRKKSWFQLLICVDFDGTWSVSREMFANSIRSHDLGEGDTLAEAVANHMGSIERRAREIEEGADGDDDGDDDDATTTGDEWPDDPDDDDD